MQREKAEAVIVYAVVDDALSPDFPLGVELEVFVRREDAERFIEEVRADEPELARKTSRSWPGSCGSRSGSSTRAG
jgi:hypothetical protein